MDTFRSMTSKKGFKHFLKDRFYQDSMARQALHKKLIDCHAKDTLITRRFSNIDFLCSEISLIDHLRYDPGYHTVIDYYMNHEVDTLLKVFFDTLIGFFGGDALWAFGY